MIRVLVLYPKGEGRTFDAEYWVNTHMPLVSKSWPKLVRWEADLGADDQPYFGAAHLFFASGDDLAQSMESPEAGIVMADVANYCNFEPVLSVHSVAKTSEG